jgi:GTPase
MARFREARKGQKTPAIAISAETGDGVGDLKVRLAAMLPSAEEFAAPPESTGVVVHRLHAGVNDFTIDREDDVFVIHGKSVERLAVQTNFDAEESAERFQAYLARFGIDEELRRLGVKPGMTVRIGGSELEWEPDDWED